MCNAPSASSCNNYIGHNYTVMAYIVMAPSESSRRGGPSFQPVRQTMPLGDVDRKNQKQKTKKHQASTELTSLPASELSTALGVEVASVIRPREDVRGSLFSGDVSERADGDRRRARDVVLEGRRRGTVSM